MLRNYQQAAHDAALNWIKKTVDPCIIEAATGAGKSHIIAALADTIHKISGGKKVLCIAPSAELVTQNHEKYELTGNPASIFSASAGGRCLRYPVIFGTPGTIKNRVARFGSDVALIVIDEAHGITPTIKHIIDRIREQNEKVRVVGLSATPYRLGDGFVYRMDENNNPVGEHQSRDAYFTKKVYTVSARYLIEKGFLTPPLIGSPQQDGYDTAGMELNSRGQFDQQDIDRAYHGHGRKTAAIVEDVINQSRNRKGVMFFAATVQHAQEVMASLPPTLSAIVTGDTPKAERKSIIKRFKSQQIKYLVNVSVLTTGFDAPHVDVIAVLRLTESVGLLQQMIGRGMRINPDKENFLILDYAGNIEKHCPDGDLFAPIISARYKKEGGGIINAKCEACSCINQFSARPNDVGYNIDEEGYFLDLTNNRVLADNGPMPAHFGRRCQGLIKVGPEYLQCDHRWTFKECPNCAADNDIAARYCHQCKAEIVDPNEKLKIDFKKFKKDPTKLQTDKVLSWDKRETISQKGNPCLRVDYVTEYRAFSVWYMPESTVIIARKKYGKFIDATNGGLDMPETITYKKQPNGGLYDVFDYNQPFDVEPEE